MINIVMGMACAGKSYFIKNKFPNATIIDLFDFQENCMTVDDVWQSYVDMKDAVIKAIKEKKENIVLEHTLLKAERRKFYIDAIKEVTNMPIDIYCIMCDEDTYYKHCELRDMYPSSMKYKINTETLEIPTKEEGFENVYLVENNEIKKQ